MNCKKSSVERYYSMTSPFIPYGRQIITDDDIAAVTATMGSGWLTTGPKVEEFEQAMAAFCKAGQGVAVSSGTAALHAAMAALGIGPGDEVIVPAITFVATANSVVYQGATPVFADVQTGTLLIDPKDVSRRITPRTKAIISVDYAGQPCEYDTLRKIAHEHNLYFVADSCHALGAKYKGKMVGSLADLTIFSFHPLKHITTGEGGMVLTDDTEFADRMRRFRNHGINADHRQRDKAATHFYDMETLGWNYRLSDIQCALGISQLEKLPQWLLRREKIAEHYESLFADYPEVTPLTRTAAHFHAWHLFVVRLDSAIDRDRVFTEMRNHGIGVNVHYRPVYLNSFYLQKGYGLGLCPAAEEAYEHILSLPMHAGLNDDEVERVTSGLIEAVSIPIH